MKNIESFQNIEVQYQECDFMGEYRFSSLLSSFSDLAIKNAIDIGIWKREMENQYGWVLSKQTIQLKRPIQLGELIQLSTRAKKASRVQFTRTYEIFDNQELVGGAFSLWTLIDLQKRKIIKPESIGIILPEIEEYECVIDHYEKVRKDMIIHFVGTRDVLYHDVDINQHMNNCRYIEWAMDLLPFQLHRDNFIREFSMYYKKEIAPCSSVDLYYGQDGKYFKIEFRNNGETCFEMGGILEKRC